MFHSQARTHITPPGSAIRPLTGLSFPPFSAPLFHQLSLPVQMDYPQCPSVTETCQPRQPCNIRRLEELRADLIHRRPLPTWNSLTTSVTSSPFMDKATPQSTDSLLLLVLLLINWSTFHKWKKKSVQCSMTFPTRRQEYFTGLIRQHLTLELFWKLWRSIKELHSVGFNSIRAFLYNQQ